MQTGDIKLIKNINIRLVLNLIRENHRISGARLAQITGMRPSTISNILKKLSKKNIILNMGKGDSTEKGGKRPYLWGLNENTNFIIGLDINIYEITATLINLEGTVTYKKNITLDIYKSLDNLVEQIQNTTNMIINDMNIQVDEILGMGIAVAGIVNSDIGEIILTDILPMLNIPLQEKLLDLYTFPVMVENNANAAALGSKWVGSAKGCNNFITILIEVYKHTGGMGMGIIINNKLYHGSSYCSGELNVNLPTLSDKLLSLRNHLSKGKILKKYSEKVDEINVNVMLDAAQKGDKTAKEYFKILGHTIGKEIVRPVAAINPSKLILAGEISSVGKILSRAVAKEIEGEMLQISNDCLEVTTSDHGKYIVSIGAASMILEEFFKIPVVKSNTKINI